MNMVEYLTERSRTGLPVAINTQDMTTEAINALTTLFPHLRLHKGLNTMVYFTDQKHVEEYIDLLKVLE